jgi:23S rRNA pseudouridine2605 synthase
LDLETEGLLLLTNDGDLLHRLTHPSSEVEREYEVRVEGRVAEGTFRQLQVGVELEDGLARAHRVRRVEGGKKRTSLRLVLLEGRKREVRRLMEAVGHPVTRLRRTRFGPVRLGELPAGRWRELKRSEIKALQASVLGEEIT